MTTTRPRRRHGKALIALLATTAALAGGAQALSPAPASAMVHYDMTEAECNAEFGIWSWFESSCDVNFGGSGSGGPSYGGVGGGGGGSSDGGNTGGGGGGYGGGGGTCSEEYPGYLEDGGTCTEEDLYPEDGEESTCALPDPDPYEGGSCELELPAEDQVPGLKTVLDHLKDAVRDFQIARDEIDTTFCAKIKKRERELRRSPYDGYWVRTKRGGSKKELIRDLESIWHRRDCDHLL